MRSKPLITRISKIMAAFLIWSGIFAAQSFAAYHAVPLLDATKIQEMFKLNAELKAAGYYMGEAEFKFLGIAYYLERGQNRAAAAKLDQLYKQLKSRDGLIKIPKFADKKAELEFYLNLQNPRTGAFMDDSYPLFTYIGPTLNMVEHLELLAKETGQPLHLKYPLKFLDQINTKETLMAFLDDLSTVGVIGAQLPKTPYIAATELIDYREIERNDLYSFSPAWKQALLEWYYENQDSKTGFWGPKLRASGELLNSGELGASFHIIRLFVDNHGNNLHSEFPLQYKDALFATTLQKLSEPMPEMFANQHDWSLTRVQGIRMLTNFLWREASAQNKTSAEKIMTDIVKTKFAKFYIPDYGAFSLYAGSKEPDLDGTGCDLGLLEVVGAFSRNKQERLWGSAAKNIADLGTYEISELQQSNFAVINNYPGINSIRLYQENPGDNYGVNVVSIVYPHETPVVDVVELLPKINRWVDNTPQNMGNWVSKESIIKELSAIKLVAAVPCFKGEIPHNVLNEALQKKRKLVAVGFDVLQIPRCKMTLLLVDESTRTSYYPEVRSAAFWLVLM
jgi:hypothetical protein